MSLGVRHVKSEEQREVPRRRSELWYSTWAKREELEIREFCRGCSCHGNGILKGAKGEEGERCEGRGSDSGKTHTRTRLGNLKDTKGRNCSEEVYKD